MVREFRYTADDFKRVHDLVRRHTGIALGDDRRDTVYARVAERLRALKLASFGAYCDRLDAGDGAELRRLLDALTTRRQSFFDDPHGHLAQLQEAVLPACEKAAAKRPVRIWCPACGTGEQAYSIGMLVLENPKLSKRAEVLGTDVDEADLEVARRGVYAIDDAVSLSEARLGHWFQRGAKRNVGLIRVIPALQERVRFERIDFNDSWPGGTFDVVVAGELLRYFDRTMQQVLIQRLSATVEPGGYILAGSGEFSTALAGTFEHLRAGLYRRKAG